MARLRALLLQSEIDSLEALRARLDDPVIRAEELAGILPEAIAIRAARDSRLGRALQETVDEALQSSVRRDPKRLSDAIFPVLGPAIRKAISATLFGMVQSLNEALNQSLSVRGIRWRVQAWRSGVPYAEVVLLNTLLYRVEQVALVHREQGVVLLHAVAPDVAAQDSDLVFTMLSAIQSFMEDAFDESGSRLDTVRMGNDLSLWIEEGSDLELALVVRGTPPTELRERTGTLLEQIQRSHRDHIRDFAGDTSAFAGLTEPLEGLLESRLRDARRHISPLTWLVAAVLVCAPLGWLGHAGWEATRVDALVERVAAIDGIVVTATESVNGRIRVAGFRDPLSVDPATLLDGSGLRAEQIEFAFEPYQALSPALVLARAQALMAPPASVSLSLQGSRLVVSGTAGFEWVERLRSAAGYLPGVTGLDVRSLEVPELERLQASVTDLESVHLYMTPGSVALVAGQDAGIERVTTRALELESAQELLGAPIRILVHGFTDPTGTALHNSELSAERARGVAALLIANGVTDRTLVPVGRGVADATLAPVRNDGRYVSFRVLGPSLLHGQLDL